MRGASGIRIPKDLAQGVADAAMADVAYNVNIIDADGVIIASGDQTRLGQVHEGALRALETGEPFEVKADEGTQAGLPKLMGTHGPCLRRFPSSRACGGA